MFVAHLTNYAAPFLLHVFCIGKSIFHPRRQSTQQPLRKRIRKSSPFDAIRQTVRQLLREYLFAPAFAKWALASQDKEYDARECVAVSCRSLRFAQQLFRCCKCGRTRCARPSFTHGIRNAEVADTPATIPIDKDVFRLEIAVNDTCCVCNDECLEQV